MPDIEGPQLTNPFDLLKAHGITASASDPRHDCRCGARFDIDPFAGRPFEHSAGHIRDTSLAASHAARAFLATAGNKGIELPNGIRAVLEDVTAKAG